MLVYFTALWYNLLPSGIICPFGIVCGHLVYFSQKNLATLVAASPLEVVFGLFVRPALNDFS
jgi:hypothetical protein